MCSIAGIISSTPPSLQQLKEMNAVMKHRGPDAEGYYESAEVAFAHNRLRIIDASSASDQPFRYMDRYVLVYNGELYNYKSLRDRLRQLGFLFRTDGDTEVVIAAFAAWGTNCLLQFDGMFAFAIWDEHSKSLFAARDRFGEKPFYYHYDQSGRSLLFASEIKALLAAGINASVNHTLLYNYLTLGHTKQVSWPDNTFYSHIFQLPPSHYISLESGKEPVIGRYFDLDKEMQQPLPEKEVLEQFSSGLNASVQSRLQSAVACGTSLSGGLDSSVIAALCHASAGNNFVHRAFSAVFPGFEKDESAYAEQVAHECKLSLFTTTPSANDFAANLIQLVQDQEEPFGSASVFAQWCVYRLAKEQGVTVLLDGQGADEVLGGYTKYTHWFLQEQVRLQGWKTTRAAAAGFHQNGFLDHWDWKNRIATMMPNWTAIQLAKRAIRSQKQNPFIDPTYRHAHADEDGIVKPTVEKLNDIQYHDMMIIGLEELLRYADRNAMAHSREVRLPFLQHELVQFIFSQPSTFRFRNGYSKWILRETMKDKLPAAVIWRKGKTGFEPPQQMWMQDAAVQELVREGRKKLVSEKILRPSVMDQPIQASSSHAAGNMDFRCMVAGLWLR